MSALRNLRYKIRYNPLPRLALNALKRLGIVILPYYLLQRCLADTVRHVDKTGVRLVELGEADMDRIAAMPMANNSADTYRSWLRRDQHCFGLLQNEELAGFCWMDPKYCSFSGQGLPLAAGQVYAYDIYTVPSQRGRNIAPLLNACFSDWLRESGVTHVVSVIDYFNRPSLSFAAKIGARPKQLNLYLRLFGLYDKTFLLKTFAESETAGQSSPS
jgi:hypothetical protein